MNAEVSMKSTKASLSIVQIVDEPYGGDMMSTPRTQTYSYHRDLSIPFKAAVERIYLTLKDQGFGVLTEIDLKDKFKEKLNVDFQNYVILGACNPLIAYQSLQEEKDLGLLLPCNVIVYESDGGSVVAAIDAQSMLSVTNNDKLVGAAADINERLRKAIDAV